MEATADRDSEGFFSGLVNKYDELWKTIIMPSRTKYNLEHLGPAVRRMADEGVYVRTDCHKTNLRGERLEVTVFTRPEQSTTDRHCLVYLHSHGGSRVEGLGLLPFAWELGMDFCVFDFSGSGMSEGAYTTLGMRESQDCSAVVELLQRDFGMARFVLWGRSMGAVAAILYAAGRLPHVQALVLDTPFSTVDAMVRDAGSSYAPLGQYLASFLFGLVKEEIHTKIGQDLASFAPIETCSKCTAPVLFLAATHDKLVPSERIEEQFEAWGGSPKEILKVAGSHSSSRETEQVRAAVDRLKVLLDRAARGETGRPVDSTNLGTECNMKAVLSLGAHKPKTSEQKENIRPTGSPGLRVDRSPRMLAQTQLLRTGSQIYQRNVSHAPTMTATGKLVQQTTPQAQDSSIAVQPSYLQPRSSTSQDKQDLHHKHEKQHQPHNQESATPNQTRHPISITPQAAKTSILYQKIAPKLPGPSKLLQVPSPLTPLASLSPNSTKTSPLSEDYQVWTKLRQDDSGLGYYEKKYLHEQQQQILREREQQFMGQPRHCGTDAGRQARPQSPSDEWARAHAWQQQQYHQNSSVAGRSQTEVFSKFAGGGSGADQSRQPQSTIRDQTPVAAHRGDLHQHRSTSRTPLTAAATPAGMAGPAKWEVSFVRDHRLVPVTSPQQPARNRQLDPWGSSVQPSGQGSPRTRMQSGVAAFGHTTSVFSRLGSILPKSDFLPSPDPASQQIHRLGTIPDPTQDRKKSSFRIFEDTQSHTDTHQQSGGNFKPLDLGWDNSLILKANDSSTSSFVQPHTKTQSSVQLPWVNGGRGLTDTVVKTAFSHTGAYDTGGETSKAHGPKGGFYEARQLLGREPSFTSARQNDRPKEGVSGQGGEKLGSGRLRLGGGPSLNYAAMESQTNHRTLQHVFRAPGPSHSFLSGR